MQFPITITVLDPADMEYQLAKAEKAAREALQERRHGVLVTRHTYNIFTIDVSEEVPFGLTRERMTW